MDDSERKSSDTVGEKEKINILLEEYKTLRAEILQKTTIINHVYTVAGTTFVGIVGLSLNYYSIVSGLVITVALLILVSGAGLLIDHDIMVISTRIREIESEINRRSGENLLKWESVGSLDALGYAARVKRVAASIARFARDIFQYLRPLR